MFENFLGTVGSGVGYYLFFHSLHGLSRLGFMFANTNRTPIRRRPITSIRKASLLPFLDAGAKSLQHREF